MVANAGIILMKSFVESLFCVLPANYIACIGLTLPPISHWGRPRPHHWCQPSRHLPLLQVRRFANDRARPWWTHHRQSFPFRCLLCITNYCLVRFNTGACSRAGKQASPSSSAYSASKFGIRALTQTAGASRLDPRLRRCLSAEAFWVKTQLWNSARTA